MIQNIVLIFIFLGSSCGNVNGGGYQDGDMYTHETIAEQGFITGIGACHQDGKLRWYNNIAFKITNP